MTAPSPSLALLIQRRPGHEQGQALFLSRVARPEPEQARILAALNLKLPERLSPDRLL